MCGHLERWRKGELVVTSKLAFHMKFFQSSQLTENWQRPGAVRMKRVDDALQVFQCAQRWQHGQQALRGTLASHQRCQLAKRRELRAGSGPCKQSRSSDSQTNSIVMNNVS
jgi:hypothetical protein